MFSIVGAYGFLFMKYGAHKIRKCFRNPLKHYELFLGLFLLGLSFVTYAVLLRFGDVSVLYPLTALNYVWVAFLSMKHLGEKMNRLKWAGVCLLILAVILVGIGSAY
ncbi:EamA family transporter [Candidatus Woesearchaeota archaeon]|nr:EamA family transporter [Candidatus Woesearchaeota archaeon]